MYADGFVAGVGVLFVFEWHVGWHNVYADLHAGSVGVVFVSGRL